MSRSKLTLWSRCQPPCYVLEVSGTVCVNCRDASRSDYEQQETDVASSHTEAGPQTSQPAVFEFGRYGCSTCLNTIKLDASLIDWVSDSFMLGDQNFCMECRRTSDGLVMQGVCKTELKSDIPACIWRVADAADFKQAPQNAPKYHIEF